MMPGRRFIWTIILAVMAAGSTGLAAGNNDWRTNSAGLTRGRWENAEHWTQGAVPGTAGHTDDDARWVAIWTVTAGPATTVLDNASFSALGLSEMNLRSIYAMRENASPNAWQKSYLIVKGDTAPLTINLGSVGSPPGNALFADNSFPMYLSNVVLNVIGTPSSHAIWMRRRPQNTTNHHVFVDTVVNVPQAAANFGLLLAGSDVHPVGAMLEMAGGSLTITNSTTNAWISLSSSSLTDPPAELHLRNTVLKANNITLSGGGGSFMSIDNSGLPDPSYVKSLFNLQHHSSCALIGGNIFINDLFFSVAVSNGQTFTVQGGVAEIPTIRMNSTGADAVDAPCRFIVNGGAVTSTFLNIGGYLTNRGAYEVLVAGGAMTVNGVFSLGYDGGSARHGSGLLHITGGSLRCGILQIGNNGVAGLDKADGYYEQTGGEATITNVVRLKTQSALGWGTKQFVAAGNAVMRLTGAGFVKDGATAWSASLLTATNLDFTGTFIFDPAAGVTNQALLAFGQDLGNTRDGLTNRFALGTLNLSALDGAEALTVTGAGNESPNALYIAQIQGLTPATAAARLKSALNIYYDPDTSPALGRRQSISLTGGGRLIALKTAQRGTIIRVY